MYQFFRFTARIKASELVDPTPFMRAEGFALAHQHLSRKGMLKSELWSGGRILAVSRGSEARRGTSQSGGKHASSLSRVYADRSGEGVRGGLAIFDRLEVLASARPGQNRFNELTSPASSSRRCFRAARARETRRSTQPQTAEDQGPRSQKRDRHADHAHAPHQGRRALADGPAQRRPDPGLLGNDVPLTVNLDRNIGRRVRFVCLRVRPIVAADADIFDFAESVQRLHQRVVILHRHAQRNVGVFAPVRIARERRAADPAVLLSRRRSRSSWSCRSLRASGCEAKFAATPAPVRRARG